MNKQEQLFNEFQSLGNQFRQLSSIVQNAGVEITWEEVERFDRDLETITRKMQQLRMPVVLYLKDEGLVK